MVTLPETNKAPEDRPSQSETIVFQTSIFGCENVSSREGIVQIYWRFLRRNRSIDIRDAQHTIGEIGDGSTLKKGVIKREGSEISLGLGFFGPPKKTCFLSCLKRAHCITNRPKNVFWKAKSKKKYDTKMTSTLEVKPTIKWHKIPELLIVNPY